MKRWLFLILVLPSVCWSTVGSRFNGCSGCWDYYTIFDTNTFITASSITANNLNPNQCVQTDASGNLQSSGGSCGGGSGSGIVSPGTFTWVNTGFGITLSTAVLTSTFTGTQIIASSMTTSNLITVSTLTILSNTTSSTMALAGFMRVYGHTAYVSAASIAVGTGNSVSIYDISQPTAPIRIAEITDGSLNQPEGLDLAWPYLYVANLGGDSISVIDVSTPAFPVVVASTVDHNNLFGVEDLHVIGNYLLTANFNANGTVPTIGVIDISTPTNPIVVSSLTNSNITGPVNMYPRSPFMYVSNAGDCAIDIVNIATPTLPVFLNAVSPAGCTHGLYGLDNYGKYLYVAGRLNNAVYVADISTPSTPLFISTITTTGNPTTIRVVGNNLFFTSLNDNSIYEYSLATPQAPTFVRSFTDNTQVDIPDDIGTYEGYLFVTVHGVSGSNSGFDIFNIGQEVSGGIVTGSIQADAVEVHWDLRANRIFADTSLQTANLWANNAYVNRFAGANLTNCGDTSHALSYSTSTRQFTCQNITGVASSPGGSNNNIQYNNATNFGGISYFNVAANNNLSDTGFSGLTISSGSTGLQSGKPLSITWASAGATPYTFIPITLSGSTGGSAMETGMNLNVTGTGASNPIQTSSTTVECAGSGNTCIAGWFNAHGGSPNYALATGNGSVNIGGLTASQFVETDASKNLISYNLFGSTQTWTGQNNWTSPSPSSFTYNVNVGSITIGPSPVNLYELSSSTTSTFFHIQISTSGHFLTNGSVPVISACGSAPSGSIVGDDNEGTITIGGGVTTACTLTFSKTWGVTPICILSDNSTAVTSDVSSISSTAVTFSFSASLGGGLVYYRCGCSGASCL